MTSLDELLHCSGMEVLQVDDPSFILTPAIF